MGPNPTEHHGENAQRLDVVLMVDAFAEVEDIPFPLPKHFEEEISLASDLAIAPLPSVRGELLAACDPRGINWTPPHKNYGANYAIIRRNPPTELSLAFDPDRRLWTCVQLSRLIRPTSIGLGHGGRLSLTKTGEVERFVPSRIDGPAGRGWVAEPDKNWIRDVDIADIRTVLAAFEAHPLPERVIQGLWQHEFLHQVPFVDVRWPLAAAGLESFVHTDRERSTRQFVVRILGIQEHLGVQLASEDELVRAYDRRSAIAHGRRLGDLNPEIRADYVKLEGALRTILVSAIRDPAFGGIFANADRIRDMWPV